VSQELIDRQHELEEEQITSGACKLERNQEKAALRAYSSSSIVGITSIQELIPYVEKQIEGINHRLTEGKVGVALSEYYHYLKDMEPLAAAGITCKIVLDKVLSIKDDDDNLLVRIYDAVGTALMNECQMRYYKDNVPGLLYTLKKNYWHKACGTDQKLTDIQIMMNRAGVTWNKWPTTVRVKLGNIMVDCVLRACNWFEPMTINRKLYIVPTAIFADNMDKIMEQARFFSAEQWPMLVPPRDWTPDSCGGYILDEVMRGHDLVRRGDPTPIQGEAPIAFLNKLQRVAYKVNPFILDVAEQLYERGRKVGKKPKFLPETAIEELPPKPVDIDTNKDARKDYCRRAAEVHNRNNALIKKSCRTRMTMKAARQFKDEERFFIPWSFDYRGRVYPIPAFLTPQDTDFGKSLIRFHEESFLTVECEEWLKFQVATTFGLDKKTIKERLEWVDENRDMISSIAKDPLRCLSLWEEADEPWQFLAACEEYNACFIELTREFTGLPIAVDATCSGMQILAGLARDASTAALVNVLPGKEPQDAYRAVSEFAIPNVPDWLQEHLDRTVSKRLVMTIPYNAKFKSNWGYVKEALCDEEKGKGLDCTKAEITEVTHALKNAVWDRETETGIFPGPIKVMDWIESAVKQCLARGDDHLEWVTPSGFVVYQRIMKPEVERMELQLLGKVRKVSVATKDSDTVNKSKHVAATSPNLIHSSMQACCI
jgi:DNA-directed RNA polymerase